MVESTTVLTYPELHLEAETKDNIITGVQVRFEHIFAALTRPFSCKVICGSLQNKSETITVFLNVLTCLTVSPLIW